MSAFQHNITTEFVSGQRVNHVGNRTNYTNGWAQSYESEHGWIYNPSTRKPKQTKSIKIVSIVHDDKISYFCTITYYNNVVVQHDFSVDPWITIQNYSLRTNFLSGNDDLSLLKFVEPSWADLPKTVKII